MKDNAPGEVIVARPAASRGVIDWLTRLPICYPPRYARDSRGDRTTNRHETIVGSRWLPSAHILLQLSHARSCSRFERLAAALDPALPPRPLSAETSPDVRRSWMRSV